MNAGKLIPIGKPISQTAFFLVDSDKKGPQEQLVLVPENSDVYEGELCIGGMGVAVGYLHAPDLTAERFVRASFCQGLIYRTGDLVQRLPSGDYVFVRRLDDQVKVGGFRIELPEIEAVLGSHPSVKQAVTIVRDNALIAYILPKEGKLISSNEVENIGRHARRSLTYYMVPRHIVVVDHFPQTANGKLDRKSLPNFTPLQTQQSEDNAESNEGAHSSLKDLSVERILIELVSKSRGYTPKASTTFVSIGVDSLGAVMFLQSISQSFCGFRIHAQEVFGPGVTIHSFSKKLHLQLKETRPDILQSLGIPIDPTLEEDEEQGFASKSKENDLVEVLPDVTSEFEMGLASNRDFLEGVRGFLTFMILWDHYHNTKTVKLTNIFQADTSLFVIMSGLTTALQLRESPLYIQKNGLNFLAPRRAFNWKNFLVTRAVGIFPILWLVILINIPFWITQTETLYSNISHIKNARLRSETQEYFSEVVPGCAVLHVTGLQTWWRPECITSGPDTYYASIIWNIYLITTFWRIFARWSVDSMIESLGRLGPLNTFRSWLYNVCVALSYGRPNSMTTLWILGGLWIALTGAVGGICEYIVMSEHPRRLAIDSSNSYAEVIFYAIFYD